MPGKIKDRKGESRRMNCGLIATITKYRNTYDIDVEFEDKRVAKHRQYYNFICGGILPEGYIPHKEDRMKETRMMNCGLSATIIDYRASDDIDIRFSNGKVARSVSYNTFVKGALLPPGYREEMKRKKEDVVVTAHNGMKMKCIAYYAPDDIEVEFEDGTVVEGKQYQAFLQGHIRNPNFKKEPEQYTEEEVCCER